MYIFSFPGYLILAATFLLCFAAIMYFRTKIKQQFSAKTNLPYRKYGIFFVAIGVILLIASVIGYLKVHSDIYESPSLLQPIVSMTSEPILVFMVSGFLVGLAVLIIGILYLEYRK